MRTAVALVGVLALSASGCHVGLLGAAFGAAYDRSPYQPETIARELGPQAARTLGCLDVGFAISSEAQGPLLDAHVGNRCGHPEALDLAKLVIGARHRDGERGKLALWDPRREIVPLQIGGAERGREKIRLTGASSDVSQICLHVEGIAPDAPESRPAPICFERGETGAWLAVGIVFG
jgi:hypothetical protein